MPIDPSDIATRDRLATLGIELTIRLGVLAILLYFSFILIRPFIGIAIWSFVLTVALYPIYQWFADHLGGRRRLAAVILTLLNLAVAIGPATWLVLGLIDSLRTLSERLDPAVLVLPPPSVIVKSWPLIGEPIYQFWELASTNIREAIGKAAPLLKPLGGVMLQIATDAGTGMIKFLVAIVIAGFLFAPAPSLVEAARSFARRVGDERGERFIQLAGATIRSVSRGVIGISILQAFFAAVGFMVAGIPAATLLTSAVLILGIVQIGPSIVITPLIIWSWFSMDTTAALLFTAYMIPVNLMDNILRPLALGRGLDTPMLVILIGVIGGTLSHGITGLFLGPIILAMIWEMLVAWIKERQAE